MDDKVSAFRRHARYDRSLSGASANSPCQEIVTESTQPCDTPVALPSRHVYCAKFTIALALSYEAGLHVILR
jgi:hypothetical protein